MLPLLIIMKAIGFFFISILVLVRLSNAFAQAYEQRYFDQNAIEVYKDDSGYAYIKDEEPNTFGEGIKEWLVDLLEALFENVEPETASSMLKYTYYSILWGLGIFAVVMILVSLFKYGTYSIIGRKEEKTELDFSKLEDQVLETDWAKLIQEAVEHKQFNVAVRLLFLQLLQSLHNQSLIVWDNNKTTSDYRRELIKPNLDAEFSILARYYNYSWFGEAEVSQQVYDKIENEFKSFTRARTRNPG